MPNSTSQSKHAEKPETNPSVPWYEEQADAKEDKVIAHNKQDIDYKTKRSDPENEPDAQEEGGKL